MIIALIGYVAGLVTGWMVKGYWSGKPSKSKWIKSNRGVTPFDPTKHYNAGDLVTMPDGCMYMAFEYAVSKSFGRDINTKNAFHNLGVSEDDLKQVAANTVSGSQGEV